MLKRESVELKGTVRLIQQLTYSWEWKKKWLAED